jgi:NAD(P)-dependent dehydrogenase (short-subunit alcohol dehydrogenase family)
MGILDNKVALVTGGGRGIGWGISRLFAREGAQVVMVGRDPATLEKAVQKILERSGIAVGMPADISNPDDIQRVVDETEKRFGRIDILIANAGINPVNPFLEIPLDEWRSCIDTNLTGSFLCIQRAGRVMANHGGGHIVIIASVDGQIVVPGEAHYGASKAALIHLGRIAAVELIKFGIYVNIIPCGWVDTDLVKEELEIPEKKEYWLNHIPAGRIATVDEIADAALFLARDDINKFVVGATLVMDGGASLLMNGMNQSWGTHAQEQQEK